MPGGGGFAASLSLTSPTVFFGKTAIHPAQLPWKVLVRSLDDDAHLGHLYQLAGGKGVPLVEYPLRHYRACGLIRELADT